MALRGGGFRGLAGGQEPAQFGDVLEAPAAGRLVEAELQRDARRSLGDEALVERRERLAEGSKVSC